MDDVQLSAVAEATEAEFMYQYESMATPATKAALGIATVRIGGGVALSMRNDVTGYWSKALGFGGTEPVTAEVIDRVVDFYRDQSTASAVIQIAPQALPTEWPDISERHRLRAESAWVKLACSVDDFRPGGDTTLRVGPVPAADFGRWAATCMRGFGMPEEGLADMMAAAVTHPGFRPFAAWDGDQMVAAANLFIHNGVGSLNSTSTLTSHRNRGAQSALIAALGKEAVNGGCRWLCAETGRSADDDTNQSLQNLMRIGLRPLYDRQNWTWSAADE